MTSIILDFENSKNRDILKRERIEQFMRENESYYIGGDNYELLSDQAEEIMKTGIKKMDAFHIACAIYAHCDYMLTTDDRVLKYSTEKIQIVTPCEFVRKLEVDENV